AIAIPSVTSLQTLKKEFIVYESSFSDILGIMAFNLILSNEMLTSHVFLQFGIEILVIAVLTLACCIFFLFLMGRMTHQVKFFLIISALVLVYAIGKMFHLSTLVIILAFGLFLGNIKLIGSYLGRFSLIKPLIRHFTYPALPSDLKSLHQLSAETAFLLRTFFFLVFGYTLELNELFYPTTLLYGAAILVIVYILRLIYLRLIARA